MPPLRDRVLEFRILTLRDPEAFGEYYQSCRLELYRFILSRTASHEVAEDLTSDVFLKTCQYIFEEQREVTHLRGFLFSVARSAVIDHFRCIGGKEESVAPDDQFMQTLVDHKASVSDQMEKKIGWEQLWEEMKKLRHEYVEILTLRFIDDLAIPEIATMLEKSEGAVRVLIHRSIKALEKQLEEK